MPVMAQRTKGLDSFTLNVKEEVGFRFRDFCKRPDVDDSQVKVASRLLDWFMNLDHSTRIVIYRGEMLGSDQPRLALTILERMAREDPEASILAGEILERIAQSADPRTDDPDRFEVPAPGSAPGSSPDSDPGPDENHSKKRRRARSPSSRP